MKIEELDNFFVIEKIIFNLFYICLINTIYIAESVNHLYIYLLIYVFFFFYLFVITQWVNCLLHLAGDLLAQHSLLIIIMFDFK